MVGDPYEVGGNWYTPQHDPTYNQVGLASWYGESFRGQLTADGEVFDDGALTAAHPTLPLPSYARVTNTVNHRSVLVRINDRGPFSNERMIDVSARTAELLDFKRYGIAKVQVEYVSPARIDGDDSAFLMASYRGPGVPAGAGATMLASAAPLPKRSAVAFPQVVPVSLPPVTVAAAADVIAPVQATTTATRPVRAVAVAATSTTAATGAPFDPFQALSDPRALMAPAAFSPGNGFKASNAPAASDTAAFRSSFAPDARVSAAFEAIASVAGP